MRHRLPSVMIVAFSLLAMLAHTGANASADLHPVIDIFGGSGLLMGGTSHGAWVADEAIRARLTGRERYRLYSAISLLGTVVGGKAEDVEESSYQMSLSGALARRNVPMAIGICGAWNALPRIPREQDTAQPAYRKAVDEVLARKGLAGVKSHITRIWRIDLNGDGSDEVLTHAMTAREGYGDELTPARKGDYSLVLLRQVLKGKVTSVPVVISYHLTDADTGPSERQTLEAVLDVNGDGSMEIITGYHAALWSGKVIHSVIGNTVKARLSSYSGA